MRTWVRVADLVKTRGLDGGFVAHSTPGLPFLLSPGMRVHFVPPTLEGPRCARVERISPLGGFAWEVCFEEIASIECAEIIVGSSCLVDAGDLPEDNDCEARGLYSHERFAGYGVIDKKLGDLGVVVEFREGSAQSLLVVKRGSDQVLIPFVDAFIVDIDDAGKRITTVVPDGLFTC